MRNPKHNKMNRLYGICMLMLQLNSADNYYNGMMARPFFPFFSPSFAYIPFIVDPTIMGMSNAGIDSMGMMSSKGPNSSSYSSSSHSSSSKFRYRSFDSHGNSYDIDKASEAKGAETKIKVVLRGKNKNSGTSVTFQKAADDDYSRKIEPKGGNGKEDNLDSAQSKAIDNIIEELIKMSKENSKISFSQPTPDDIFGSFDFSKMEKEFEEKEKKDKAKNAKICKILEKLLQFTE